MSARKPDESQNLGGGGDDAPDLSKHPYDVAAGRAAGLAAGQKAYNIGHAQTHRARGHAAGLAAADADLEALQREKALEAYALENYGTKTLTRAQQSLYDAEIARDRRKSRFDRAGVDERVATARAEVERERRAPTVAAELAEHAVLQAKLAALRERAELPVDPPTPDPLVVALERRLRPDLESAMARRVAFLRRRRI